MWCFLGKAAMHNYLYNLLLSMEPAQVSFWPRIFLWSSYSSRRISAVLPLISWTCNALDFDGLWLGTLTVAFHMRRLLLWHLRTHAINLRQLNWKEQRHTWQEQPHTHMHTHSLFKLTAFWKVFQTTSCTSPRDQVLFGTRLDSWEGAARPRNTLPTNASMWRKALLP